MTSILLRLGCSMTCRSPAPLRLQARRKGHRLPFPGGHRPCTSRLATRNSHHRSIEHGASSPSSWKPESRRPSKRPCESGKSAIVAKVRQLRDVYLSHFVMSQALAADLEPSVVGGETTAVTSRCIRRGATALNASGPWRRPRRSWGTRASGSPTTRMACQSRAGCYPAVRRAARRLTHDRAVRAVSAR